MSSDNIQHSNGKHQQKSTDVVVPPLKTLSINELLSKSFEPLRWIIPEILPEGLTLLFSRPKIGKSMMALALSLRIARRTSGGVEGDTLYLSLDDTSERRLQSRVRSLLQGAEVSNHVWFATESRSLDTGLIGQLTGWMYSHPKTCLIVIDVFGTVKPKRQSDDVFKNDYDALFALRKFATEHHIAILLVHHTRKVVDSEDWINNINGSTGLSAACDTIWMLKRQRGYQKIELLITGRDTIGDPILELDLDDLDAPWKLQGVDAEDEQDTSTSEEKVLFALQNASEALTPKQIAEITQLKSEHVRKIARRMLAKALIYQTTYGLYHKSDRVTKNNSNGNFVTLANEDASEATSERVTKSDNNANCHSNDSFVTLVLPIKEWVKDFLSRGDEYRLRVRDDGDIGVTVPDEMSELEFSFIGAYINEHVDVIRSLLKGEESW